MKLNRFLPTGRYASLENLRTLYTVLFRVHGYPWSSLGLELKHRKNVENAVGPELAQGSCIRAGWISWAVGETPNLGLLTVSLGETC